MRPRYHIRWKVIMWAMMLVAVSFILTGILSPIIGEALSDYISVVERGWFILWINQGLTSILFFVFVLLLAIFTSKTMVNRILELSQAAKQIAKGDFSVRISDVDRHDEVYQLAKDFNRMAEQLQSNEYMRKDFISNVSHEIKTPLSVINGYVDLLQEDPPEKDRREYLNVISRESRRLLHLSQNL
ncbi:MAG: histidine kinase dimerization/phospho-acceptor domain-containing protein, partial [Bacillota bacterium]|nr:histidine kinase dimerization/phospho-acceptor domain-containing protein [Bacillota bacterium]